jgi:hypothetical protein
MFYLFFICFASSEAYPLLLGVSTETTATTAASLGTRGTLPANLCLIIVDQVELPPFTALDELSNWANAGQVCQSIGKVLTFPAIESSTFNFLDAVRNIYPPEMKIDTGDECACAIKRYAGGLVVVRIPDNESKTVSEIVKYLPKGTAIAFLSATDNLFRY